MDLAKHYRDLLLKHGDSPEASQYSSRETQEKRFEILLQIGNLEGKKILDFGCGTGHLATYIKQKGINVIYTGVDIVEDLFEVARQKHPEHVFCKFSDIADKKFDYVLISGVFNNKVDDNRDFYQRTIKQCFSMVLEGLAFNMMSYYVEFYDPDLFYEKPEFVFEFLKKNVSPYITLRNDFQVKDGVIPFEFAAYVYRK
jgi:SAM-dependent methyltransferase